jgi:hypothetical protein
MAIHKNIQFLADTAIKDLEIITIEAKKINGELENSIKI